MKLIFESGFEIAVNESEIEYTISSPVFFPLSGKWSYPFTIKATEEILAFFDNPHLVNILRTSQKTYSVLLVESSYLIADGDFSIEYANDKIITASLTATPGNISQKIWSKKLNTFEIGEDIIPTQNLNYTFYKLNTNEMLGTYQDVAGGPQTGTINFVSALDNIFFKFKLELFIGAVKIFDETYTPELSEISSRESKKTILDTLLSIFNASAANKDLNELIYNDTEFLGIFNGLRNEPLKLVFTYYRLNSSNDIRTIFTFLLAPKKDITVTNYLDNSLKTTWNKPYQLPEVVSPKHYSQSSNFCGVINKTTNDSILRNTNILTEKTKYSHVPMLRLTWVLSKLFSLQNYTLSGTFIDHPEVNKILIFNTFTTDKLIDGISYNVNVHSNKIVYANHLPDETFADYLQMIIDEFGLALQFNPLTRTVQLNFFDDIIGSDSLLDLSDRMSQKANNNHAKAKKTQILWTLSGDALAKEDTAPYISIPTKKVVETKKEEYEPLNLKIPGLTTDANAKPRIEASCVSPLFGQTDNTSPLRFIFYEGKTGKTETAALSFDLNKPNGIYQKFLRKKVEFEDNTINTETSALLTLQELVSFNFSQKFFGLGVKWLVSSLSVKLKSRQNKYLVDFKQKRVL